MIGMASYLLIIFSVTSVAAQTDDTVVARQARSAVKNLDDCLIAEADRLQSMRMEWLEKYSAFMGACAVEREAALDSALRREWERLQPEDGEDRLRAARISSQRIQDRFEIWAARALEPAKIYY
jgi:hypothetical protein